MKYPFNVMIIKADTVLRRYCGVGLWSHWKARIKLYKSGSKIPKMEYGIYIQKEDSPKGEVRLSVDEIRILKNVG